MAIISRKRILRVSLGFGGLFVALFLFRLLYGYYGATTYEDGYAEGSNYFDNITNLRKNYASEKLLGQAGNSGNTGNTGGQVPADFSATQKYEKTATVRSKTEHFEEDEALIRKKTESFNGSIQYEQSLGKKGNRELHLSIGVKPAAFDSFYRVVQGIGELRSTVISKVDKTNEYRQLNAKKASLEKTLGSLNELKNKGGAISDFVQLHDKILEVETQLQELGVDLGNYNTENEFCTLRFSLFEGAAKREASLFQRVKTALEWTIRYYALSIFTLAGVLVCAFLLLLILDRMKILAAVVGKLKD